MCPSFARATRSVLLVLRVVGSAGGSVGSGVPGEGDGTGGVSIGRRGGFSLGRLGGSGGLGSGAPGRPGPSTASRIQRPSRPAGALRFSSMSAFECNRHAAGPKLPVGAHEND